MTFSSCCFQTIDHDGNPTGKIETVAGLESYVTGIEYGYDKVIVVVTDILGHKYKNNQLVADQLSRVGKYLVVVPDLFYGDSLSSIEEYMEKREQWGAAHGPHVTGPLVDKFLAAFREEKRPKFLAGVGHCFGAMFVVPNLKEGGLLDAGGIAHPSNLTPEDLDLIRKPVVIATGPNDPSYTQELINKSIESLTENKVWYQLTVFEGVQHGFAVRGDLTNKKVVYAQNKVIRDQIEFFAAI